MGFFIFKTITGGKKMVEVVNIIKDQVKKLNLVVEGLEDNSKLSYPAQ